ncbi:MAG TPA: hypothetical protein VFM88_06515 [Vicinamibacteria bacterium]|nr:hypothetical protein [Vicinamibacteria bacterium]
MARGFESKQVEDQQAEAERRRERRNEGSREDPVRMARRRSLEMARVDVSRRLDAATAAPLREMLKRALEAIDAELRAVGSDKP